MLVPEWSPVSYSWITKAIGDHYRRAQRSQVPAEAAEIRRDADSTMAMFARVYGFEPDPIYENRIQGLAATLVNLSGREEKMPTYPEQREREKGTYCCVANESIGFHPCDATEFSKFYPDSGKVGFVLSTISPMKDPLHRGQTFGLAFKEGTVEDLFARLDLLWEWPGFAQSRVTRHQTCIQVDQPNLDTRRITPNHLQQWLDENDGIFSRGCVTVPERVGRTCALARHPESGEALLLADFKTENIGLNAKERPEVFDCFPVLIEPGHLEMAPPLAGELRRLQASLRHRGRPDEFTSELEDVLKEHMGRPGRRRILGATMALAAVSFANRSGAKRNAGIRDL
jgi:hypothetical protein